MLLKPVLVSILHVKSFQEFTMVDPIATKNMAQFDTGTGFRIEDAIEIARCTEMICAHFPRLFSKMKNIVWKKGV